MFIKDLTESRHLDHEAMCTVRGGLANGSWVGNNLMFGSAVTNNFVDVNVTNNTYVSQYADIDINVLGLFGASAAANVGLVQSVPGL